MPDVELALEESPDTEKEDEEARQFILKVKKTIERCLQEGMNKEEMFRVIREEGLPTWITFVVFMELRTQNHDFFKEYYNMHDLKKQREKLDLLIQAYRAGGGGVSAPETATTAAAMETDNTASMKWSDQQAERAWSDEELARPLSGPVVGGDQFTDTSLLQQQAVCCPGGQQPHDDLQMVYDDELLQEMGTSWAEEVVSAPTQSVAMFQGVAWSQQPAGQQQLNHQERARHLPAGQQQLRHQELDVRFPGDQQPR